MAQSQKQYRYNLRSSTHNQTPPVSANNSEAQRLAAKNAWLKNNAGFPITTFDHASLQLDPTPVDSTSGSETVCSYNWRDVAAPTIYVPGAPPTWVPPNLPITVEKDKGGRFIDQNTHRCPQFPFEPMFKATTIMNPEHDFSSVNLIANRNSLRHLLDFVKGKVWDPFRIDLDMVHDTLVLTRRERWTKERNVENGRYLGFGTNFEKGFTTPQVGLEDSTSHHRAARYKLGDLDCVVRYEVDACMDGKEGGGESESDEDESSENKDGGVRLTTNENHKGETDLLASLEGLSLEGRGQKRKERHVQVIHRGTSIKLSRLAELKTKAKPPVMSQLIPQLWFGRIPTLVVGTHDDGTFKQIMVRDTTDEFTKFEKDSQDNLRKLVYLIKLLTKETVSSTNKAIIVVCESKIKPLSLSLYEVKEKRQVLPPEMIQSHWKVKSS